MENIVYCGMDCTKCPIYIATKNNDVNTIINMFHLNNDVKIEDVGCEGCNSNRVNHYCCDNCVIKKCCIDKKIPNCGHCDNYPCDYVKKYLSLETINRLNNIHNNLK